jgi:hypothetical protein
MQQTSRITGYAVVDSKIPENSAVSVDVPVRWDRGHAAADRRIPESSAVSAENQDHKAKRRSRYIHIGR